MKKKEVENHSSFVTNTFNLFRITLAFVTRFINTYVLFCLLSYNI